MDENAWGSVSILLICWYGLVRGLVVWDRQKYAEAPTFDRRQDKRKIPMMNSAKAFIVVTSVVLPLCIALVLVFKGTAFGTLLPVSVFMVSMLSGMAFMFIQGARSRRWNRIAGTKQRLSKREWEVAKRAFSARDMRKGQCRKS